MDLNLTIGTQKLKQNVLIADIENDGILRMDFLAAHKCVIMLTRKLMRIKCEEILCFANSRDVQPRCCRVAVLEPVVIPPEPEIVESGYTRSLIDNSGTGLIEADEKFMKAKAKGLLVAKALVCSRTGTMPIRIANPYSQSFKLYKNTIVASYEPLEPVQLLSVNSTQSKSTDQSSSSSGSKTDIPELLKELFAKSSQTLSPEQQRSFKDLLMKQQNQLSKNPDDLGRTTLMEHHMNVKVGTKPIKQHPYRLQNVKMQKMR